MNITKYDHSCFLIEKDGRSLIFDPVEYEHKIPTITNLDGIIITHSHGDHFQPEVIQRLQNANPNVQIFATTDNTDNVPNSTAAKSGDKIPIGVFNVEFFSEDHAEIISGQFMCKNIGAVVDGTFAHPGDSLDPPPITPEILAVATVAPWLKISDAAEYIIKVHPKIVIPAHDALNSDLGNIVCDKWIAQVCAENNITYIPTHHGKI